MSAPPAKPAELAALLIAPNRDLAERFLKTMPELRTFQILADLRKYPTAQALEIRLRQLQPEVVLLDLTADRETAEGLIRVLAGFRPPVHVVALAETSAPDLILRVLQLGASEFLAAPFEPSEQRDAVAGILKLRQPEAPAAGEPCRMVAFASAKPGSGASVLACQAALVLRRITGQRILLADLDLSGGTVGFYLRLKAPASFLDVLERSEQLEALVWASLAASCRGVEVLPAPPAAREAAVEPDRIRRVLDHARRLYDWVVLDLPAVFHRVSLLALAECDRAFLVSTSELPSLHLTRKAVTLLGQLGIGKDRLQVLVNRTSRADGMGGSDFEKIFNCPARHCFPNDSTGLHRALALGEPLEGDCVLGRAVEEFAGGLAGISRSDGRPGGFLFDPKPALAGT